MRYSILDYIRFALFVLGQLVLLGAAFFVTLSTLGEYRMGVLLLAFVQLPLSCIPPIHGNPATWKRYLWRGTLLTLSLSVGGYVLITIFFEKYLILGPAGSWLWFLVSLVSMVLIWVSSVTRVQFVIGHGVLALFGMVLSMVSLWYQVPFSLMDQSMQCEGETYRVVEYVGFKGERSYAYFQTTSLPLVYNRPDWRSIGLECLEAGLENDILKERFSFKPYHDASERTSIQFDQLMRPSDILAFNEYMDMMFRSEDIYVTIEMLPSPRDTARGSIREIQNPPSERAFKELIVANVSPDTYDPLDAPIIQSLSFDAPEGAFDEERFLALLDPRFGSDVDDFGDLDPVYWRERILRYQLRGIGSYYNSERVYREALFEYEGIWYDDFLKINEFVGSVFDTTYYTDYFYEVWFAVDRPQEWRDIAIVGGGFTQHSQESFEQQYRFTVQMNADNDWNITLRPEELDIYQNHLHRYVLFPDTGSETAARFDYLFGQEIDVSAEQQEEWDGELRELGLSREQVQQGTREVILSDYVAEN